MKRYEGNVMPYMEVVDSFCTEMSVYLAQPSLLHFVYCCNTLAPRSTDVEMTVQCGQNIFTQIIYE